MRYECVGHEIFIENYSPVQKLFQYFRLFGWVCASRHVFKLLIYEISLEFDAQNSRN